MPEIPILMPQLGESIAEATVIRFLVEPGAEVTAGQSLIEVETSKAVSEVTSPVVGRVERFVVKVGESYAVGELLGVIRPKAVAPAPPAAGQKPTTPAPQPAEPGAFPGGAPPTPSGISAAPVDLPLPASGLKVDPVIRGLPVPAHAAGASFISPRLKARMEELGLHAADLAGVAGTGAAGRVTIDDFERFLAGLQGHHVTPASSMRIAVADAMRRSWTRPLATVALPLVLDPLLAHRRGMDPKPGPALYALRALAVALAENSAPAGRLIGSRVVHPGSVDIGFAVEAEDGVLVPVLRQADKRPLKEMVGAYQLLVEQARLRRLPPDSVGGSIATVTNFGTFGLTWATPIPLPEQSLVLGMGAGRKVPFWDEAVRQFVPVTEANLTLSFDHRVIDGGAAGRLLSRVAELMRDPARL